MSLCVCVSDDTFQKEKREREEECLCVCGVSTWVHTHTYTHTHTGPPERVQRVGIVRGQRAGTQEQSSLTGVTQSFTHALQTCPGERRSVGMLIDACYHILCMHVYVCVYVYIKVFL